VTADFGEEIRAQEDGTLTGDCELFSLFSEPVILPIFTSSPAFIFSSISCSCFSALRKADLSLDVCSAFNSFLTFCKAHLSQSTYSLDLLAASLFFQQGEKSTRHCEHIRGLYGINSSKAVFNVGFESISNILSTTSSKPTSIIKSILFTLGMALQSAGGGLGGGI